MAEWTHPDCERAVFAGHPMADRVCNLGTKGCLKEHPPCTCPVGSAQDPDPGVDPACHYHGENGCMVSVIRVPTGGRFSGEGPPSPPYWQSVVDAAYARGLAEGSKGASPEAQGALDALLAALERKRVLLWTGNVLVELECPPEEAAASLWRSQATMVLDESDFAALLSIRSAS